MATTYSRTILDNMQKKLKFACFSGSVKVKGVQFEVYYLNDEEYRIFKTDDKSKYFSYIDIKISDYEDLDHDQCKNLVRFWAVEKLFYDDIEDNDDAFGYC